MAARTEQERYCGMGARSLSPTIRLYYGEEKKKEAPRAGSAVFGQRSKKGEELEGRLPTTLELREKKKGKKAAQFVLRA